MSESTIWSRTQSLLVFYVFSTYEDFQSFRISLDKVLDESNVKRLKVVVLIKDLKQNVLKHSLFSYITEKDIHFFTLELKKRAKNEFGQQLEVVRHSAFDVLLCFGRPTTKVMKWLMKIEVKEKIGVNVEGLDLFDLNLNLNSSSESIQNSVLFVRDTLQKIK
jgi:hypothetical protein